MSEKRASQPRNFSAERPATREKPRALTKAELLDGAMRQFRDKISEGDLARWEIERFVSETVTGIKINGVDVISIDIGNHKKEALSSVAKAYLGSKRTKTIVVEYFEPELRKNGVYAVLHPVKSARNYGRSMLGKPPIPYTYAKAPHPQLRTAIEVASALKDAGKPVAVADIANQFGFPIAYSTLLLTPILSLTLALGLPSYVVHARPIAKVAEMVAEKGMYNKKRVTKSEHWVLDFEQARRLYLAKGVEQLTKEQQPEDEQESPQIVVLYPRAHTMRMEDTLLHPRRSNKVKSAFYKTWAPYLNFSVRHWRYRKAGVDERGRSYKAKWIRESKKRITM